LDALVAQAHRFEDVAGLVGLRGARAPVADANDVLGCEHECFSVKSRHGQVEGVLEDAFLVTVQLDAQRGECAQGALPKHTACLRSCGGVLCREFRGKTEPNNEWDGEGAGAQSPFLPAAECEWGEWWPLVVPSAGDERPDAFWSVDLVSADAHQIDARVP